MKVSTRLAASSGLFLALLSAVAGYQLVLVGRLAGTARVLAKTSLLSAVLCLEQLHDFDEAERLARKYFLTGDPDYALGVAELARTLGARQKKLESLATTDPERAAILESGRLWSGSTLARTAAMGPSALPRDVREEPRFLEEMGRQQASVREAARATESAIGAKAREAEASALRAQKISAAGALAALLAGGAVLVLNVRSIREPLRRLTTATKRVAQGRFEVRMTEGGGDEFEELARDFNTMVERLSELDGMKRDLLSNVSHDLKGPLASMQETARLLMEEIPGPLNNSQRKLLGLSLQSADRLSSMIAKLLDMAHLESGTLEYDLSPLDLAALSRAALSEQEVRAAEMGIRLGLSAPLGGAFALADRDRFLQVMANLLENALKFAPRGSRVEVSLEALERTPEGAPARCGAGASGWIMASVADEGPGVPEAERSAIFERFRRLGRASPHSGGGIGLGLAICREIVAGHGGAIWVEQNPGGGSVFRVLLPAANVRSREEDP